jgi:hypothetical protein
MIEYLYNAIRATAGEDITIAAEITDNSGFCVNDGCALMLWDDEELLTSVDGMLIDDLWNFTIPAAATTGFKGRYWYCICHKHNKLQFKEPLYLV